MPNAVYDDQEKDIKPKTSDDELRAITGIGNDEEKAMEQSAAKGAADDILNKENSFGRKPINSNPDGNNSNASGAPSLYNPINIGRQKFSLKNVRITKTQGGLIGLFVALGASLLIGISTLGPLQFVHFAQMLQAFHFSDQEYDGNSRIKKLIIYSKTKNVNNTRLGIFATAQATKIDKRLAANGWEIKSKGAVFDGFAYDPAKKTGTTPTESDIKKGRELHADLERQGVKVSEFDPKTGKFNVSPDGLKYWSNRSLIRTIYSGNSTDVGKITAAFEKRILVVRAGISWNPITKLDQAINKTLAQKKDDFRKKVSERVKGEVNPEVTAKGTSEGATEEEKAKNAARTEAVADETNALAEETKSGKMTAAKLGGVGAAGVGLLCMVNTIAKESEKLGEVNRAIPLMQASALVLGTGSKAMAGDDIDMIALGELTKNINTKTGGSFTDASSIRYEQGEDGGKQLTTELEPTASKNMINSFLQAIPGLDTVCGVFTNSIVSIGLGIATGGGIIATFALEAIAQTPLVQGLFEHVINYFTNDVIDITDPKYAGAIFSEAANVGSRMNANETAAAMGGLPMSATDEVALNSIVKSDLVANDKSRSIADKYLSPYNYDTPVAKAIDSINPSDASATLAKIPGLIFGSILRPFSSKIHAEDDRTPDQVYYGIKKVGFAPGELDSIEDPYANAEEVRTLLKNNSKYVDMLKSCNKIIASGYEDGGQLDFTTERGTASSPATMGTYSGAPAECTENKDKNFLKIRVAAFDTITMKAFSCIEFDDNESCTAISG